MKNNTNLYDFRSFTFILFLIVSFSVKAISPTSFDGDKPTVSYNAQYSQIFNGTWDNTKFYNQWVAQEPGVFSAADITDGYLKFEWIRKRVICSVNPIASPYVFENEIDYGTGSNRGGVVIRATATNINDIEFLQQPPADPGFNREGIAFYPSADGQNMIVQFSGVENGAFTQLTKIQVPKPALVSSMLGKATLRIEDFGTTIYVYFNGLPYVRIDLGGKSGTIYTSGTVYNANLQVIGTFSEKDVNITGKVSVCERDATLRLYSSTINYNELITQKINFNYVGKKLVSDPPFIISATATSGLPVDFKLISGPATLVDATLTLTGQPGIITVSCTQNGNALYFPATEKLAYIYVSDSNLSNVPSNSQDYVDNWVVTDALGRQLPNLEDAGGVRNNKQVGVFYYVWHGAHGKNVHDITKILAANPSNISNPTNPGWGAFGEFHFWGEPEVGYYRSEDPWVIRRDLQMLSNAHVDFIFLDATNGYTYLQTVKTLCDISLQMRSEGIYTPEILFLANTNGGAVMNSLYDDFYAPSLYEDLWYKWNGKPLILGDSTDVTLRPEVKDFFTIKYSWAWTEAKSKPNHWQWLDTYPQDFGWNGNPTVPEQITVSLAQHPYSTTGSSYKNGEEPEVDSTYLTNFTGQGAHFDEQWRRALQVDPAVVMVTQWNEWAAQRNIWEKAPATYAGRPIKAGDSFFIDAFNEEFNRDISPMKNGHSDNYYYQLIFNIRKFKGMSGAQVFSAPKTIAIDGSFADWSDVTPIFKDPIGDVMHRNSKGYDPAVTFVNTTGRNDIVESRTTFDAHTIYFYVKTAQNLTPSTDPNWMLLFIDADRNKGTGWEGYDYVLNLGVKSTDQTTLKQWDGKTWSNEIEVPYKLLANQLEISIPRNAIMKSAGTPEFYFHWADNPQHLNDISSFFTDGESAPDRRFNYNFSSTKAPAVSQTAYKANIIPGLIEFEDFDNGGAAVAYVDATLGNRGGEYRMEESVDVEAKTSAGYNLYMMNNNEWLKYTIDVKALGTFTLNIDYAATTADNSIVIYVDDVDKTGAIDFASTHATDIVWGTKSIDLQLNPGKHVLKVLIKNTSGAFKLDRMDIIAKNAITVGEGTGLNKSVWNASAGGRTWFQTLLCSGDVDPDINLSWAANTSPGCGANNDFWNISWEGLLLPLFTETYTFYLTMKDMGRVWINNELIVDGWVSNASGTTMTATKALVANQKVPIKVDFAKKTGAGAIKLEWSSASNPREVIPQYQLFPLSTGIQNTQLSNIRIYPNPAKDQFSIFTGQNKVEHLQIVDLQGRVVFNDKTTIVGEKTINFKLNKGMYLIHLHSNRIIYTQKIIVD